MSAVAFRVASAALVAAALGCVNLAPSSNTVTQVVLPSRVASVAEPPAPVHGPIIAVPRVLLPAYLESRYLVYFDPDGTLNPLDGYRWAEPLADGMSRSIAAALRASRPDLTVRSGTNSGSGSPHLQVLIEFETLMPLGNGSILVSASALSLASDGTRSSETRIEVRLENAWNPSSPSSLGAGFAQAAESTARTAASVLPPPSLP